MKFGLLRWLVLVLLLPGLAGAATLTVGSKRFTESFILGEIIRQTAAASGDVTARHRQGLGNTSILFNALTAGQIDVYVEYTGTISKEILKLDRVPALSELNKHLAPLGLRASAPLGFNNTYAIAVRGDLARSLGLKKISDLRGRSSLRPGFGHEFLGRADGWPGLSEAYGLRFDAIRGLDHGLAFAALANGEIDLFDVYSTDAQIGQLDMVVLTDDLAFFPRYDAVLLHRLSLPAELPKAWSRITGLEGALSDARMRELNAAAEISRMPPADVAAAWVRSRAAQGASKPRIGEAGPEAFSSQFWRALTAPDFLRLFQQHLSLVLLSLAASIALGVPLGVLAFRVQRLQRWILGVVGVIQTVPSLALLAFLIPLTGSIGAVPALIALALYGLLPIVRNTTSGLEQIPLAMRQAGSSLGLTQWAVLRHIELPLALPVILAGIKTAAVISVGTATIAAFIGAGGFGERIVTGLALHDNAVLLAGAVPAAAMALLVEWLFSAAERVLYPGRRELLVNRGRS
ncbi:MAG: ABC transporter permease subunit [Betaproteobacteria bacterium]|nr:ABC transporter permease subunit [Betaproteobacteria bacterium]